jgi:hypothetical protein
MANRVDVYKAIDTERAYQHQRWGVEDRDERHPDDRRPEEWLTYMKVYLDKAFVAITSDHDDVAIPETMHIIRKIAAMTVVCMETWGAPTREGF